MVKVSVVVPAYNAEKYLEKCLDSLVKQTLKDIEIIVVNDASTDNSYNILKKYEKKYKNIVIINNKINKGIGYNRNIGIKTAKGEYISFIDSDDYADKHMMEELYNRAIKEKSELVVCNYYMVQEDGTEIKNDITITDESIKKLAKEESLLLDINLSPWNKLYKKSIIEEITFPENLKYEDVAFVIKALNRANQISFVNKKLYYYIIHQRTETTTLDKRVFDIFKILDIVLDELKDNNSVYKEALIIRTVLRYTLQQKRQKDKKLGSKFIDDAFSYLNKNFPNWKNNEIYRKRTLIKRVIEKNKFLTKLYIKI